MTVLSEMVRKMRRIIFRIDWVRYGLYLLDEKRKSSMHPPLFCPLRTNGPEPTSAIPSAE